MSGMAADIGTLQRLPKIAGNDSLVRELCLTGRFFDASTAARVGLVSRVVSGGKEDVLREALDVAREIARWSPVATVGTKHLRMFSLSLLFHRSLIDSLQLPDFLFPCSQSSIVFSIYRRTRYALLIIELIDFSRRQMPATTRSSRVVSLPFHIHLR